MLKSVDAGEDDDAVDDAVDDAGVVDRDVASVFTGVVSDVIADIVADGELVEIVDVDVFFSFLMHLVGATSNSISGITAMLVVAFCAHFCS